jgi:hypothetical protein
MDKKLYLALVDLVAPEEISKYFVMVSIVEKKSSITITFEEKGHLVPKELKGRDVVLDGFVNPIELQTFPLKDKQVFLSIKRRRWKERGKSGSSYSNTYDLYRKGMKTTREFGNFLKEDLGLRPSEYNKLWESDPD